MAELTAKHNKAAAETRLLIQLKLLTELVTGPVERRPTEQRLRRELAAIRTIWEGYDLAHFSYSVLLGEAEEVIEQEAYSEQSQTVHDFIEQGEALLDTMRPGAVQVPQVDANVLYGTAKQQQVSFYDEAKDQVATIEACLEPAATDAPLASCASRS